MLVKQEGFYELRLTEENMKDLIRRLSALDEFVVQQQALAQMQQQNSQFNATLAQQNNQVNQNALGQAQQMQPNFNARLDKIEKTLEQMFELIASLRGVQFK